MPVQHRTTSAPRLRQLLVERGMSIAELSRRAGLPYGTATRVVFAYQSPTAATRRAIAKALKVSQNSIWPEAA